MNQKPPEGLGRGQRPAEDFLHGDEEIGLPVDVEAVDWASERRQIQNPRIRSVIRCVRSLESVLDSNYAILHCSPRRLREIWRRVRDVSELIRSELAPLLRQTSQIPDLEQERRMVLMALELLESSVLKGLDRFPMELESGQMTRVRKLLCVSMGKIHAFLQDAFARILSADPRSHYDKDYFFSQRFPHDVEDAEWLHATVERLKSFLLTLEKEREHRLTTVTEVMAGDQMMPAGDRWRELVSFLDRLRVDLVPRLREVLSLRGVRFDEMEALDRHAREIPTICSLAVEIGSQALEISEEIKALPAGSQEAHELAVSSQMVLHTSSSRRLCRILTELDHKLGDLAAFVPFWLEEISRRRALMLHPAEDSDQEKTSPSPAEADEAPEERDVPEADPETD
jgi:hypothetical protein